MERISENMSNITIHETAPFPCYTRLRQVQTLWRVPPSNKFCGEKHSRTACCLFQTPALLRTDSDVAVGLDSGDVCEELTVRCACYRSRALARFICDKKSDCLWGNWPMFMIWIRSPNIWDRSCELWGSVIYTIYRLSITLGSPYLFRRRLSAEGAKQESNNR